MYLQLPRKNLAEYKQMWLKGKKECKVNISIMKGRISTVQMYCTSCVELKTNISKEYTKGWRIEMEREGELVNKVHV